MHVSVPGTANTLDLAQEGSVVLANVGAQVVIILVYHAVDPGGHRGFHRKNAGAVCLMERPVTASDSEKPVVHVVEIVRPSSNNRTDVVEKLTFHVNKLTGNNGGYPKYLRYHDLFQSLDNLDNGDNQDNHGYHDYPHTNSS